MVGLLRCSSRSRGLRVPSYIRKTGLRRPDGLNCWGLRRPGFKFSEWAVLFLRRCDDRNVPWRDNENGLLDDMLPGLFPSCCDKLLGLFCDGLRFLSMVDVVRLSAPWNCKKELGLRRSDGDRRVRKLCDLALRIFGKCLEWW